MSQPLISVIMPTFNCLDYLPHAVASVFEQGIVDIELLIADDGSTDDTWSWLQAQATKDSRIKPIQTEGVGPATARNVCITQAKGEYIGFLDSDDTWRPGKLKKQIEFLQRHPNVILSFTDYWHWDVEHNDLGGCFDYWPFFDQTCKKDGEYHVLAEALGVIYAENIVGTSTAVVRQNAMQIAGGFDPELPSAEDWDLWLRLARQGDVAYSSQVGMDYLLHRPGSMTQKTKNRIDAVASIAAKYKTDVMAINKKYINIAEGGISSAKAEQAASSGNYYQALIMNLHAFYKYPHRKAIRAISSNLKKMIS